MILLVHPPVSRPSEPPPGLARLAGALTAYRVPHRILDVNVEGLLFLLSRDLGHKKDTRTVRAFRHASQNIETLKNEKSYENIDRYRQAVHELNHLLQAPFDAASRRLQLGNYQDARFTPLRSENLLRMARTPEENPFFPYFRSRLTALLEQETPGLIGFSLNYLSQAPATFAMLGFLKREAPGVPRVLGGGLVTSWASRPGWKNPFTELVDHLIPGPGEEPLLALAGIREAGMTACLPNLDGFPRNAYLSPGLVLPYDASSGCYWRRCAFCPERAEGKPYRPLPAGRVLEDLKILCRRHAPRLIHFVDNALSPSLLRVLAETRLPAPWYGFARVSGDLDDDDFVRCLRSSGCVMLKLGIESGSQAVLDKLNKGIDVETASRVLTRLHRAGIAPYGYFLFGTPAETEDTARETLRFIARNGSAMGFMNLALFNLPAFGPESDELETRDFYEGDLALYRDFEHPLGWNRDRVRIFLDRTVKRHPTVAAVLRREPPSFGSSHAPLFAMAWKRSGENELMPS